MSETCTASGFVYRTPLAEVCPLATLVFRVSGKPQSKQRPRFGRGRTFTSKATESYELDVRVAAEQHVACIPAWILDGRYHVSMTVSYGDRVRRDIDNIAKAILDGMNRVVYLDDHLVHAFTIERVFDDEAYVDVTVHAHAALEQAKKARRRR